MSEGVEGSCDAVVVGAGIVGLATARELLRRRPWSRVIVLERESRIAAHQTSHNSGVIHAGVYYEPGSLKARLCTEGARELYEYCEQHEIDHRRCGKLIVATRPAELERLDELQRRAAANGVSARRITGSAITQVEPECTGLGALHVRDTGIVDFAVVAAALAKDIEEAGGAVVTGCAVLGSRRGSGRIRIQHERGELDAARAIFCAGAWADRLAVLAGADPDPRIVPFRGAYAELLPERAHLVRTMIYPVPDPQLPFLGVHLTRGIDGVVRAGPTALLALARDGYALTRLRPADAAASLTWPGTWRLARRWWRTGAHELRLAAGRGALASEVARFVPGIRARDLRPAGAGVRAQAVARDGRLVDDFAVSVDDAALHVRNAPSPAATSALALARLIADRAGS